MATDSGSGSAGVVAVFAIVAIVLVGGFLYFTLAGGTKTASTGAPSVNITTGAGGGGSAPAPSTGGSK